MFEIQRMNEISIKDGDVANIKDSSGNIIWQKCEYLFLPKTESNGIYVDVIDISKGDTITIYYCITNTSGYVYDGSNCGCGSLQASSISLNSHGAKTVTATSSGKFIIAGRYSNYQWGIDWPNNLAMSPLYGDYIRIKIN